MNKVLRSLILSDLFISGSFGLIQPIFAVFMLQHIGAATIATVGIATSVQLGARCFFQIGIASWADCRPGNCRELYILLIGSLLISAIPLGYIFAHTVFEIYLIQFCYGIGQALNYPSWRVIFSNYLDHNRAGYEWGLYDTTVNIAIAATAAIGAVVAEKFGFTPIFIGVSVASFIGCAFVIRIFKQEFTCRAHIKMTKKIITAMQNFENKIVHHS